MNVIIFLHFWISSLYYRKAMGSPYSCIVPRKPESVTIGVGVEFEDELGSQYATWSFKNSGVSLSAEESSSRGNSTVACEFA